MSEYWKTIPGWFNYDDLYNKMVADYPSGSHFIEIGTWKGKSAAYMAEAIKNSGKNIQFDCIDTFKGSLNESHHQQDPDVASGRLFDVFTNNMKPLEGFYKPVISDSAEAASLYEDASVDFVFIDAAHDYDSVVKDIAAWQPKVKKGGVLSGHDVNSSEVSRAVAKFYPKYKVMRTSWFVKI